MDNLAQGGGFCLNESPSEKEGKFLPLNLIMNKSFCLNESPSEKEGKFSMGGMGNDGRHRASMKVPPKRKGNL